MEYSQNYYLPCIKNKQTNKQTKQNNNKNQEKKKIKSIMVFLPPFKLVSFVQ